MTAPDPFTDEVRRLLAQNAETLTDSDAPYDAIVRAGRSGQRRRQAAMGLGAAVLIAAPATAVATGWNTGPSDDAGFAPAASPSTTRTDSKPATSRPVSNSLQPPGSPDQLRDGLTLKQANESLRRCFAQGHTQVPQKVGDYRLLLAWRIDANPNEGGTGIGVVAVSIRHPEQSVYCRDRDETHNVRVMNGDGAPRRMVTVDANSNLLYRQITGGGPWDLPYRWAQFGVVDSRIKRVTVSYGGRTVPAIIDRNYFVAAGTLREQTSRAPVVKGYDADGALLYDSTKDQYYDQLV